MKVIYLGTPEFAVKPLQRIIKSKHQIVACVTQPDRAANRCRKIVACPVKKAAVENNIKVMQYDRIRDFDAVEELKSVNADIMVTCAYGQILSEEILNLTKHGVINIHASLLPKYRGSSPVQWALICGEKEVGVTIMQTEREVDSGDIILQDKIALKGDENTAEVLDLLSPVGAELIVKALDLIEQNKAEYTKQDIKKVCHFPMLKKEDGKIDFNKKAFELVNFIRGMNPWPSAFTFTQYGMLKVKNAEIVSDKEYNKAKIGEVVESNPKTGLIIKCSEGCLSLLRVQGENAKEMDTSDFLRGKPIKTGTIL